MAAKKALSESMEDYLEAIFHISEEKHAAKARDIARQMKVNSSSVTGAMHILGERGLINYSPYDLITLTAKGDKIAREVIRRHEGFRNFLVKVLDCDKKTADEVACKMEHAIPQKMIDKLISFTEFVQVCPRGGTDWLKGFGNYCDSGKTPEYCEKCIDLCLEEVRKGKKSGIGKSTE